LLNSSDRTSLLQTKGFSGIVVGVSSACFILGLLIVNLRLAKFGIYSPDFVRTEYVLVGAVFLFLVATAYFSFQHSLRDFKAVPQHWKQKHYFRSIGITFFGALTAIGPLMFVFSIMTISTNIFKDWWLWISLMALVGFGHYARQLYIRGSTLIIDNQPTDGNVDAMQISKTNQLLGHTAFLLLYMGIYANYLYPHIPPSFGGGNKTPVILIPTAKGLEICKILALPLQKNQVTIGPIEVLTESENELVVLVSDGLTEKKHAIRLKRELFDAIQATIPNNS